MKTDMETTRAAHTEERGCPHPQQAPNVPARSDVTVRSSSRGFSLIEMIGVLAIIAIVASVITPNLARRISRINGEKEDDTLAVLGDGLARYVKSYQVVPGANTWVTNVSTMTGLPVKQVRYFNADTNNARVYLIHPTFVPTNAATSDPLWTQASAGATLVSNARIIIVSSQKANLALPISSGKAASTAAFDAIWDWNFDPVTKAPPSGWPGSWTGNGEYLHVQRINLAGQFYRVTFSNSQYPSVYPLVQFGSASATTLNSTSAIDAYYIQSTPLRLYKDSGAGSALDLSYTVESAMNFLYESNRWRIP
jgi:prepilin-type N-terminal cleavage/methylation domain-containing protein